MVGSLPSLKACRIEDEYVCEYVPPADELVGDELVGDVLVDANDDGLFEQPGIGVAQTVPPQLYALGHW